jgi:hypothetical protein
MKLRHLSLLLWIAVFLAAAELALEWRAHRRGYGTLLFSVGGLSAANSSAAAAAESGFGPTEDHPFRSRVHAREKGASTVRIWIASASYAEDRRHPAARIFPVLLEDALRARGHDVEVLNASRNAYSLAGAERVLGEIGAAWQPDLVLAYHYSNDLDELSTTLLSVAGAATPGAADEAPASAVDGASAPAARTEAARPWPSRVAEATTLYAQAKNQFKARLVALRLLEDEVPEVIVAGLESRVLALEATAESLGAQLVLCRFACSHPSAQGGALPLDYRNNLYRYNSHLSERAWRDGVDVFNGLLSRLGAERGLAVLALDERVAGQHAHFRDFTHLTEAGHRAMADALADLVEPLVVGRSAARGAAPEAQR